MPKLPDKVEDWTAPWETATGETEIEKDKLKRYLFNLLGDKEKLQERLTESNTERDELKTKADAAAREGETNEQKLARENEELKAAVDKATKGGDDDTAKENLRLKVAIEKGLNEAQLKRLIGSTKEELLADADELLKSFGSHGNAEEGEGGETGGDGVRRVPAGRRNPGDPNPGAGAEVSVEKALEQIPRVR
jgi:hypothetical protein